MRLSARLAKAAGVVGYSGARDAVPPRYRAITPGLIVTDRAAWAWYTVPPTNSDLLGEIERDHEQDRAEAAFRVLAGREWHIRGVWGWIDGEAYLSGLAIPEDAPAGTHRYHQDRAGSIDALDLPERVVLLGIKLTDRTERISKAGEALGISAGHVGQDELTRLQAATYQLGRQLHATVWQVRLAAPELLAWSIAREMHREAPLPSEDTIVGAPLARLAQGRVDPAPDHVRFISAQGAVSGYGCVLALTDFPETMQTPGHEWLAVLSGLETTPLDGTEDMTEVLAEFSVRGRSPRSGEARSLVDSVRRLAKEQRRSADQHMAGEPPEEVEDAYEETSVMHRDLSRGRTSLTEDHPRVLVYATTRPELEAKVVAVQRAYDDMSILATVMVDEQREGWLETLPCDQVRVSDLGHYRDITAAAQSWFWGGAAVGSRDPRIPAIGYTTGSGQGLTRYLATEGTDESDAPLTLYTGRTRRGKTVGIQMGLLDVCMAPTNIGRGPWAVLLDLKGDADGLATAARHYGLRGDLITVTDRDYAGVLDDFLTSAPEHAVVNVAANLALLLPTADLGHRAASLLQRAAAAVAIEADPRSYQCIAWLEGRREDPLAQEVAEILRGVARTGFGRMIIGTPIGSSQTLSSEAGISVIQVPGLYSNLPKVGEQSGHWTPPQRIAVAVLRAVLGWLTHVSGRIGDRTRPKAIAIPEAHLLTATADGVAFLDTQARVATAFGLSLMLDTQDVSSIATVTGVMEGTATVFGFAQKTRREQDALAGLLALPESDQVRETIAGLDRAGSSDIARSDDTRTRVRRGHCLYLDRSGAVAAVQWEVPTAELLAMLDTSAAASGERAQERERAQAGTEVRESQEAML